MGWRDDAGPARAPREPLAAGDNLGKLLEGFRTAGLPLHYFITASSCVPAVPSIETMRPRTKQGSPSAPFTITTPAVGATGTVTATRASLASGEGQAFEIVVNVGSEPQTHPRDSASHRCA